MRYLLSGLSQGRRVFYWGCWLDDGPTGNTEPAGPADSAGRGTGVVGAVVDSDEVALAMDAVAAALPLLPEGASSDEQADAVRQALANTLWTDPHDSARTLAPLTEAFLPDELARVLRDRASGAAGVADEGLLLVVHPCRPWALLPWELLPLTDGNGGVLIGDDGHPLLLLDVADVQYAVPAAVAFDRPRHPDPYDPDQDRPLYTVDPEGPESFLTPGSTTHGQWYALCREAGSLPPGRATGRHELSRQLHGARGEAVPTRWLYVGHCAAPADPAAPTSAGLKLSEKINRGQQYDPLTAYEMIMGDQEGAAADGPTRWPMPSRVSLIACASGTDQRHHEPLGLVTALINAGAEYVTATRWVLPTDYYCNDAMTNLAMAVDHAHKQHDPLAALASWQRDQLAAWRADPTGKAWSPLLWAAPTTFRARNVKGQTQT